MRVKTGVLAPEEDWLFIYRCALCGVEFQPGVGSGKKTAIRGLDHMVVTDLKDSRQCGVPLTRWWPHECATGGRGIAELIGVGARPLIPRLPSLAPGRSP